MLNLVVLIGTMTVTSYVSVPQQTDSSPFRTSTGERVSVHGVAISRDRLCGACRKLHKRCARPDNPTKLHYGDLLYVEDVGYRFINDVMGKYSSTREGKRIIKHKQNNWLDIWVDGKAEERIFHKTHGIKQHKIYLIRAINEAFKRQVTN